MYDWVVLKRRVLELEQFLHWGPTYIDTDPSLIRIDGSLKLSYYISETHLVTFLICKVYGYCCCIIHILTL